MTPKEKAQEMVDKFIPYAESEYADSTALMRGVQKENSKQCATIAVDEILQAQPSYRYWDTYDDEKPSAIVYWQEVREEIEKL